MGQQEKQNNIFCETIKSHACRNWPWTECDIWVLRFITVFPTIRIYQMQLAKFNRTNFDLHICMRCVLTVSTLPGCAATSRASGYKQTGSLPLAGNLSKRQEWLVESCGSCDKFRFFCRVDLFFVWDSQSLCISVHICEKSEVDWGGREAKGVAEDAGTATTAARPTFWWRRTRWATERISEPSCAEKSISTHGLPHVTTCYHKWQRNLPWTVGVSSSPGKVRSERFVLHDVMPLWQLYGNFMIFMMLEYLIFLYDVLDLWQETTDTLIDDLNTKGCFWPEPQLDPKTLGQNLWQNSKTFQDSKCQKHLQDIPFLLYETYRNFFSFVAKCSTCSTSRQLRELLWASCERLRSSRQEVPKAKCDFKAASFRAHQNIADINDINDRFNDRFNDIKDINGRWFWRDDLQFTNGAMTSI